MAVTLIFKGVMCGCAQMQMTSSNKLTAVTHGVWHIAVTGVLQTLAYQIYPNNKSGINCNEQSRVSNGFGSNHVASRRFT
jgi:hypothetical protein